MGNAIMVINPYKYSGLWVFDDDRVELVKEPFIEGADRLIDLVLAKKGIANADSGFRLIFSAGEFPRYDARFDWVREGDGGNWYSSEESALEGWLCPALLKYFDSPPKHIYARFEARTE